MYPFQKQTKQHLLKALSSLPAPKNDYEIVVPEDDPSLLESASQEHMVEDQADMDSAKEHERLEKRESACCPLFVGRLQVSSCEM